MKDFGSVSLSRNNTTDAAVLDKEEFTDQFDYVMVFPLKNFTDESKETKHCLHEILAAGMEIYPYKSVQDDELIVLIRCPVRY
jgi:hypothetical protein